VKFVKHYVILRNSNFREARETVDQEHMQQMLHSQVIVKIRSDTNERRKNPLQVFRFKYL